LLNNIYYRLLFLDISLNNKQLLLFLKFKFVQKWKKYKEDNSNNNSNYVNENELKENKYFKKQNKDFKKSIAIKQNEIVELINNKKIIKTFAKV